MQSNKLSLGLGNNVKLAMLKAELSIAIEVNIGMHQGFARVSIKVQ